MSELDSAGMGGYCSQMMALGPFIDLVVHTLNGPPLYAGLDVNGSQLIEGLCAPTTVLISEGVGVCTYMPQLSVCLSDRLPVCTSAMMLSRFAWVSPFLRFYLSDYIY